MCVCMWEFLAHSPRLKRWRHWGRACKWCHIMASQRAETRICVTWLIQKWHDSFVFTAGTGGVIWYLHKVLKHTCMYHDSFSWHTTHSCSHVTPCNIIGTQVVWEDSCTKSRDIYTCDLPHSHVPHSHASFTCTHDKTWHTCYAGGVTSQDAGASMVPNTRKHRKLGAGGCKQRWAIGWIVGYVFVCKRWGNDRHAVARAVPASIAGVGIGMATLFSISLCLLGVEVSRKSVVAMSAAPKLKGTSADGAWQHNWLSSTATMVHVGESCLYIYIYIYIKAYMYI